MLASAPRGAMREGAPVPGGGRAPPGRWTGPEQQRSPAAPTSAGEWETEQNKLGEVEREEAGQPWYPRQRPRGAHRLVAVMEEARRLPGGWRLGGGGMS
jgi:hypothetical protein